MPAAPAQVIADLILRNIAERVIERFDPQCAIFAKGFEPHLDPDTVPQCGEPSIVHLHREAGRRNHLVLDAHGVCEREQEFLGGLVKAVGVIRLEACRRGGREKASCASLPPSAA